MGAQTTIEKLRGPFPALPTPLHDDASLDLEGLDALVDRLLDARITARLGGLLEL